MTLTEFLLARIAEDGAVALEQVLLTPMDVALEWDSDRDYGETYLMVDPARILSECEAKRRIVEKAQRAEVAFGRQINPATSAASFALTEVLHLLALAYVDHPDYDEAWRL